MKTQIRILAGVAAIAILGDASVAFAQAKPAAGAAKPAAPLNPAGGADMTLSATTPGVCVLSREAIVGASKVGKAMQARLAQLESQANAELTGEQTSIQAAAKDLEAKKTSLGAAYQTQGQALQQRANALQDRAAQRERELQATEQKAVSRVLSEATPLVAAEAKAKNCAIVVDANAVMAVNVAMNLTPAVITALDGKLQTIEFEREHLDAPQAGQQR